MEVENSRVTYARLFPLIPRQTALGRIGPVLLCSGFLAGRGRSRAVPLRDAKPIDFMKKESGTADLLGESIGCFKVYRTDVTALGEETRRRLPGAAGIVRRRVAGTGPGRMF
jgi:hypothetical protein